jgi:hypothetical protein
VLIVLGIGLIVYALWRLFSAAMPGPRKTKAKVVIARIGYVISAIVYGSFAFTAFKLASTPADQPDGNGTVSSVSASVMRHSGGRIAIGLAGLVLIGAGVYRISLGLTRDVNRELELSGYSPARRKATKLIGAVGEAGRGVALCLIGFFMSMAALQYRPDEATGLDGALRRAARHGWSQALVAVVAAGFICYGVFCLLTFMRRRFEPPR